MLGTFDCGFEIITSTLCVTVYVVYLYNCDIHAVSPYNFSHKKCGFLHLSTMTPSVPTQEGILLSCFLSGSQKAVIKKGTFQKI